METELSRCRNLLMQQLSGLINAARSEIAQLWNLCYVGADERDAFTHFTDGQ